MGLWVAHTKNIYSTSLKKKSFLEVVFDPKFENFQTSNAAP